MSRFKKFSIRWHDAWNNYEEGYYSLLEIKADGSPVLCFMANNDAVRIDLGDREAEFIDKINETKIEKLNNYCFYDSCEDGDTWLIYIIYDDKDIAAEGHCTMPRELRNLILYLNTEWNLPICKLASWWFQEKEGKLPKPRYGQRKWLDDDWRLNNREDFVKLKMESLTN